MDYFFIVSNLGHDLVMDVKGADSTADTPVIVHGKKSGAQANQLWTKKRVGDTTFKLVSKLGPEVQLAIDVASSKAVVRSFGSLFREMSDGKKVTIVHNDTDKVLDVEGSSTTPGTRVIAYQMKPESSPNQTWEFYPANC